MGILLRKRLTHIIIVALNYIDGGLKWDDMRLLGRRPNAAQASMLKRITRLVAMCDSPGAQPIPVAPGRSGPEFIARLLELEHFAEHSGYFDHRGYSAAEDHVSRDRTAHAEKIGSTERAPTGFDVQPYSSLNAERLKIVGGGDWDIQSFLHDELWLPYCEPKVLHHSEKLDYSVGPSVSREDPEQYLRLAHKWESHGLLALTDCAPHRECFTRIFNAWKNEACDRQIGDRRLANSSELHVTGPSRFLPSGYLMCNLHIPRGYKAFGAVTDRKDFYHQCSASVEKAKTNVVPFAFPSEEFAGTKALANYEKSLQRSGPRNVRGDRLGFDKQKKKVKKATMLYPAFQSLLQGDHLGVEVALSGHEALLQEGGLLQDDSRILAKHPFPTTSCIEGLVIDDYFAISIQPAGTPAGSTDAMKCLDKAKAIYDKHQVLGSPEKDVLGSNHFKVVGAEINTSDKATSNGVALIGAPLEKRIALAALTLKAAALPVISTALASRLAGNWTSIFMFRRCLACLINELYGYCSASERHESDVFRLDRSAADELVLASIFSFIAVSDLAAPYIPKLFATDASLQKGAVTSRPVPPDIASNVWLGGDRKGTYTMLDKPFRSILRGLGDPTVEEDDTFVPEDHLASPQKAIEMTFDFVEVCAGVGSISKALAKRGRRPCPPIELSDSVHFNVENLRLIEWLCHMLSTKRIRAIMVEPVCTTFSAAAYPAVRSYRCPRGFDMTCEKTKLGNLIAFRCLYLLWYASLCGAPGLGEQPRLSKMCWLSIWRFLVDEKGFEEAVVASCQFGSPHRKEFRLICKGLDAKRLEVRCPGGHEHLRIEGKYTKESAIYVPALADHIAEAFDRALRQLDAAEAEQPQLQGIESVICNDLLSTGTWTTELEWFWRSASHINILESHAYVSLLRKLALDQISGRFTNLLDSRVAKGSHAKGRSSAKALCPSLKKSAALQIGAGLYPSYGFAPTRLNTADAPTRDRDLPQSADHSLSELLTVSEVRHLHSLGFKRHAASWIRLTILILCLQQATAQQTLHRFLDFDVGSLHPWISDLFGFCPYHHSQHISAALGFVFITIQALSISLAARNLISHGLLRLGFVGLTFTSLLLCFSLPVRYHEPQPLPLAPWFQVCAYAMPLQPLNQDEVHRAERRHGVVLVADRVLKAQTRSRRETLLDHFETWLLGHAMMTLHDLLEGPQVDAEQVSTMLVEYGKEMYYSGKSYGRFSETINAVGAKRPVLRRQLVGAWDLAFAWVSDEPHFHHPAMPLSVVLAFSALGLLWGWPDVSAVLLMTWAGILRIGEVLAATRADLVLPRDSAPGTVFALLQIRMPKTRGVSAKHQSARIDPCDVVRFLDAVFGNLNRSDRLWSFSPSTLRKRFAALQQALGLPTRRSSEGTPFDLASLRAGGATHLLQRFEDAEFVRRRGRWLSSRVMEIYLQEVSVTTYAARMHPTAKSRIERLSSAFPAILEKAIYFLDSSIPRTAWPRLW